MNKLSGYLAIALILVGVFSSSARAATWYLQGYVGDWNTLSSWYSQPLGGGTHPTSILSTDNFDLNGYRVNTSTISTGTATFGGNELILHGGVGGYLSDKAFPAASVVIGTLVSDGGYVAGGGGSYTPGITPMTITTFINNANTTFNGGSLAYGGINLTVGTLSGAGDICAIGAGGGSAGAPFFFTVTSATGFTGTLHIADGCGFTFENAMTSGGALEVEGAGTTVTLNYTVTFKGLTINGTAYAPGTYTAASLGAPFSGSGSVVVQAASTPTSPVTQLFGVNLPGGSFGSGGLYPTSATEWSYYQGKQLNLVRVAFLWEYVQPTLGGPLSTSALASLDSAVSLAAARGMQVILDMHDYDHYPVSGTSYLIGSTQVPYSDYQGIWQQLAAHYANTPGIYGYDIMNEPNGDSGTWDSTTAQDGVNGVRQSDTTHYIIVEGDDYAGAQDWMDNNANFNVTDSANKLIYSAHSYWDSNNSGTYSGSYDSNNDYPNIGVDHVAQFVYWLGLTGNKGYIGEFGVPNNVSSPDYRWNVTLNNFLSYLNVSGVEGTYWSGGHTWVQTYPLLCALGNPPVDAPAMSVLENYGSTPSITSGTPPAPATGTVYSFSFQASAYPDATFSVSSGTLPPGLALTSSGVLSGTPTQSGSYSFTIAASNGAIIVATQTVSLNVSGPPASSSDTPTMPFWALLILAFLLVAATVAPTTKTAGGRSYN